jgi:ubiquinone/menaquinone biosynthesis C-methylase UbiE
VFEEQWRQRSRSFDAWALEYDTYRPTYPQALFDHVAARLTLPAVVNVADLGAGTGKAARQMARRGWHVTAIEPGEGMLDVLKARAQSEELDIDARLAGAEETGLAAQGMDLVTCAQAFHWFDKERAVPEMARIVRPAGGVAVFWNARADDRSPFLAEYTDLSAKYLAEEHVDRRKPGEDSTAHADLSVGGFFEVDERVLIPHEIVMTHHDFVSYVFTASQIRLFVEPDAQVQMRRDIHDLLHAHFGESDAIVAYDVDVYFGRRTEVSV